MFKNKSSLPKLFWVINASNTFERGAYYGTMAIFSYHLVYNLGMESWVVGILLTILMPFLYFMPLVSTALARKFGFRNLLLFAYSTICLGYISIGFGSAVSHMLLAVLILGLGAGFEKALISASIAHSVEEDDRSYAYSIYYWLINFGAFVVPLVITFVFAKDNYGYAFFLMAAFIAISFSIIFTQYRNPVEPEPDTKVFDALKDLKVVLEDKKFALLLLINSGFWFMFAMNHSFLPLYMVDFNVMPLWFTVTLLATVNPGTIIFLGPFLGKIMKKYDMDPLKLLIIGIMVFTFGLLFLGLTMHPVTFFLGIVIFSIGEFIAYPAFLSYVSTIPPQEKVSIYMGYSFLPSAIGLTLGSIIGGVIYFYVAESMGMGRLFWAIIATVGFASASALMYYEKYYEERGEITVKAVGGKLVTYLTKAYYLPILLIPVILVLGASLGSDTFYRDGAVGDDDGGTGPALLTDTLDSYGNLAEGEVMALTITPENATEWGIVASITLDLTWEDEPDVRRIANYENQGDTFELRLLGDGTLIDSQSATNDHGQSRHITINAEFDLNNASVDAVYTVEVELVECGDLEPRINAVVITDDSNDYGLDVSVAHL